MAQHADIFDVLKADHDRHRALICLTPASAAIFKNPGRGWE